MAGENKEILEKIQYLKDILLCLFTGMESDRIVRSTLIHYASTSLRTVCEIEKEYKEEMENRLGKIL